MNSHVGGEIISPIWIPVFMISCIRHLVSSTYLVDCNVSREDGLRSWFVYHRFIYLFDKSKIGNSNSAKSVKGYISQFIMINLVEW